MSYYILIVDKISGLIYIYVIVHGNDSMSQGGGKLDKKK